MDLDDNDDFMTYDGDENYEFEYEDDDEDLMEADGENGNPDNMTSDQIEMENSYYAGKSNSINYFIILKLIFTQARRKPNRLRPWNGLNLCSTPSTALRSKKAQVLMKSRLNGILNWRKILLEIHSLGDLKL